MITLKTVSNDMMGRILQINNFSSMICCSSQVKIRLQAGMRGKQKEETDTDTLAGNCNPTSNVIDPAVLAVLGVAMYLHGTRFHLLDLVFEEFWNIHQTFSESDCVVLIFSRAQFQNRAHQCSILVSVWTRVIAKAVVAFHGR